MGLMFSTQALDDEIEMIWLRHKNVLFGFVGLIPFSWGKGFYCKR